MHTSAYDYAAGGERADRDNPEGAAAMVADSVALPGFGLDSITCRARLLDLAWPVLASPAG